jgi:D-alanyl-D-alanine carboxypeptidase
MSFYTDVIQKSPHFNSVDIVKDMDLLEPTFRQRVEALLAQAQAEGRPMMVFETYRSNERQLALFNQKLTQLKTVGVHHYGLACDICYLDNGKPSWKGDFTYLGKLADSHDIIWGGDWGTPNQKHSFRDMDHVQRVAVADQNKLFAGTWYPDANYDPFKPQK